MRFMRFQDLPIRRKLVSLILLISISVLVVAAIVMLFYQFGNSRREMATKLTALSQVMAANSSAALVFDDPALAQEILSGIQFEPEVMVAALYDAEGKLYVRYPKDLPAGELRESPAENGARFGATTFSLYTGVFQRDKQVGTLYLAASYEQLYYRMAIYVFMLFLVLAGSAVLALFLSNLFESRISQPMLQLARLARVVSEQKDFSVRAVKAGQDELGTLTDAFNAMLAQIQASDRALRENERRFREMIDALPAAVYTTDAAGWLAHYNPAAVEVAGRTPKLGEDQWCISWKVYHPDGRPMAPSECPMAQALREGRPIRDREVAIERPDGTRRWVMPYPTPLFDGDGNVVGGVNMLVDITERKNAEVEREELLRREREARAEAETLNDVARTLAGELDLNKLVQTVTDAGARLIGASFGAFLYNFHDAKEDAFELFTLSEASREAFEVFDLSSFKGKGVVCCADLRQSDEHDSLPLRRGVQKEDLPVRSYLAVPVVSRSSQILGGLFFGHSEAAKFDERDERLIVGIAAQAAIAIDNARLFAQAEKEIAERRQAELALRESEARERAHAAEMRAIMEAVPAVIWIARDPACREISGNPISYELLRLPKNTNASVSASGPQRPTHFKVLVEGKVLPPEEMPVQRAARGEEVRGLEEEVRFDDGTSLFLLGNATPLRNADGEVTGAVAAFVDITQRKRMEMALQESERRFRMIADNITVFAWTADELGVGTWFNKQWYDYTGLTEGESLGWGWERLVPTEHLQRVNQSLARAMKCGELWEDTFPIRGRDGRLCWFLSRAVPIHDEAGKIIRWFGTNADITDLREAEQSILRLAAIVECSQDAIVSKSLDGIIQTWNRGAERMFGYKAEEVVGKSIKIIIPPERDAEENDILNRQRRGERLEHFETVRVRKDGTRLEVSLSVSPLRNQAGAIVGISKIARDVTEQKRAQRQLEKALAAAESANRAKDDFLAALSHELRTPLMPVMFTISMLQQDRSLPANLRNSLSVVRRNIEIQSRMINDLLDLSRIRADRLELVMDVVDLHEVAERAYDVCRGHQKFPQVRVNLELDALSHFVRGDADRLQQILWNLLTNALKFTPPGGTITLRSENSEQGIRLSVADTGCGIEPDLLAKIFQPFEQGGRKGKEALQGLGLGLAIAQRIAVAHGGSLSVSSRGRDLGAVFTLELACVPAPPEHIPPPTYQPELLQRK